ncbi:MAG TPA: hypothetical protein V6D19_06025 [Stenomitos sp.]
MAIVCEAIFHLYSCAYSNEHELAWLERSRFSNPSICYRLRIHLQYNWLSIYREDTFFMGMT